MVVRSRNDKAELRVLIAPRLESDKAPATIAAGDHEIFTIPISGNGTIELVGVQMADARGTMLTTNLARIAPPRSYALLRNYPNPFNAGTVIPFDLQSPSDWTVSVYNITGQVVRTYTGRDEASHVSVTWDGTDKAGNEVASGIYFYRITTGDYTATKKMTLLK